MHIALLSATISIPEAHSLKDKRRVVKNELTPFAYAKPPLLQIEGAGGTSASSLRYGQVALGPLPYERGL